MKIAYLARRPIPSRNAHSVQIVKMCEAFAKLGHQVDLFASPGDAPPDTVFERYGVEPIFRTHHLPRSAGPAAKWRHVWALLRSRDIRSADLLFGRDILSLAVVARFGRPLVYEAHVIPPPGSARWRRLRRLFALPNFSHLVCVTSTLAEAYLEQFPELPRAKVIILPNAASGLPKSKPLGHWPGRKGAVQVGFIGRPFPGKGIELLVSAAVRLPDIDFHVVGADAAELSWIKQAVPPNLHLHGYQPHARLGAYLQHFDIAVAPYGAQVQNASGVESASITSPLKLLEYMAAGLATIVSDLPGVRDILGHDEVAVVTRPGDEQALIEAIERLAKDPAERRRLGSAARERYKARHTVEARALTILAAVNKGSG